MVTQVTEKSKKEFRDLVVILTEGARFHTPPNFFGDEYFQEGYILGDGRRVLADYSPLRSREDAIDGQMRSRVIAGDEVVSRKAVARYVDNKMWYEGKPINGEGVPFAYVNIEKDEQVETYRLYTGGKFSRTFFGGHLEEGKQILSAFEEHEGVLEILVSGKPITDPTILKYLDYRDKLSKANHEAEEAGLTIVTESEARATNALLNYIAEGRKTHLMDGLEFYQRIVDETPEHLFTENKPQYKPFRDMLNTLNELKRLSS